MRHIKYLKMYGGDESVKKSYIKKMLAVICGTLMVANLYGCSCGGDNQETASQPSDVSTVNTGVNTSESENTADNATDNTTTQSDTGKQEETTEASITEENTIEEVTTEPPATTEEPTTTEQPTTTAQTQQPQSGTPYGTHGKLSVSGTKLVDKNGNQYSLKGVSTHGIAWFPQYVSYDTFKELRDVWGANVVRIAMYTAEYNGYCSGGNKEELKALVKSGVDAATELGLYVIVDWHILSDTNPWQNKDEAVKFFSEISAQYKNQDNVIYEICNEPNSGTSWADIKSYAMEIIPVIRANDSDAIIIVGTPTWSQDVDTASYDKITGYDNIMYTLHYYAATHKQWLRDKAQTAINNGCALFVTEFSICDASGNGALDIDEANQWLEFLNSNGISFVGWNLANKNETSSLFLSSCNKTCNFTDADLSEWAKWLKTAIKK